MPAAMWNQKMLLRVLEVGGVALALLGVSILLRRWFLRTLKTWSGGERSSYFAVLGDSLETPTIVWCLLLALNWVLQYMDLPPRTGQLAGNIVASFLVLSLAMAISTIVLRAIQHYGERNHIPMAVAGLSRTLVQVFVFGVGLLVMLRMVGISITPVLTALGVGGLAVALAVQDTLANLFAGIHILIERPITVGDYVRIGAGEEGTVSDIGWRTTRLLSGDNSTVVIPNKNVTASNLLNYSLPGARVGVSLPIILGLDADLALAEKLAVEAALATHGVLPETRPSLSADPGMTPTHLQYRLGFQVHDQISSGAIKSDVLKRVLAAYRKAGMPQPEPGRRKG